MTDTEALDLRIADALDAMVNLLGRLVSIHERVYPTPIYRPLPMDMKGEFHESPKDLPPMMNSGIPAMPSDF